MQPNPDSHFAASYDRPAMTIPAIFCAACLIAGIVVHHVAVGCFGLLTAHAFAPRGYAVSRGAITVRRVIGNITVPRDQFAWSAEIHAERGWAEDSRQVHPVTIQAGDVGLAQVRVVDIATDPEWRTTARTNGFANPLYHAGRFRVASGKKVRLYNAYGERLVLLSPRGDGVPVLLEVKEPETFIEEIRREWRK